MSAGDITDNDRLIMQLRALGYSQEEIADRLNMSQSAVSQRIQRINRIARQTDDPVSAFWDLVLGVGALYVLYKLLGDKK